MHTVYLFNRSFISPKCYNASVYFSSFRSKMANAQFTCKPIHTKRIDQPNAIL